MRNLLLAALLLAVTAPALAQDVKFERGTVSMGDTVEKMLKVAGKPHAIHPLNKASRDFKVYEYLTQDQNINFTVKDGKIVAVGVGRR